MQNSMLNLAARLSCGAVVNESVRKIAIGADSDTFHLIRDDVVFLNETQASPSCRDA